MACPESLAQALGLCVCVCVLYLTHESGSTRPKVIGTVSGCGKSLGIVVTKR